MTHRLILALCLMVPLLGCPTATTTPPPAATAPSVDPGPALAAADQFYNRLQTRQVSGDFKPTAAEVTALNALQQALAVANPVYLAYKAGTGSLQAAQDAAAKVSTAQTNAQNLIGAQ
jgi:hypothetical protein